MWVRRAVGMASARRPRRHGAGERAGRKACGRRGQEGWLAARPSWIVEACPGSRSGMVAPFGGTDEMLKDLEAKVFKDREARFRAVEGARAW